MNKIQKLILVILFLGSCQLSSRNGTTNPWEIRVIPSSVRLDPSTNEVLDFRFNTTNQKNTFSGDILHKNWIYDGEKVSLHAARGEYVSFQLVLTNNTESPLKAINVEMIPFSNDNSTIKINPEMFLEWAVEVKTLSTGYPNASLGKGWYPDALIPFKFIQMDSTKVHRRWTYPLELPDFNNRIDNQKSIIVWIDQYIPFEYEEASPGTYKSTISVVIGTRVQEIPVELKVWNFALPNQNLLKASLQHEGFLSRSSEKQELEVHQLFKRNRIGLMDPTYDPGLQVLDNGEVILDWTWIDDRLKKYFTGEAFTSEYGYDYGPGYGEPIETYILPFDVFGKHGTRGWPDIGKPDVERNPENVSLYRKVIKEVRDHLRNMVDPEKTELFVYLNGLDESYFPEAWDRMVFFGDIFKEDYPEVSFRIDGSYSEEAMEVVQNSISSWAAHTINYNYDEVRKYQGMGINDWLYGPMLYEARVNSWSGSSTFIDLPLINDRAISWSSWKYNTYSWISWGVGAGWINAWYDPETWKDTYKFGSDSDAGYFFKKLNGNGMLIYSGGVVPNVNGPCPSIRLKTMRNGVQEYEYMRLLSGIDGNSDRANEIVNSIIYEPFGEKSIGNLDVWSFEAKEWDQKRIQMGELIHNSKINQ
jgi:hypothetical protein